MTDQSRAADLFALDALDALMLDRDAAWAVAAVNAALSLTSLPVVLGRLARFRDHVDSEAAKSDGPLMALAVVVAASVRADGMVAGAGDEVPMLVDHHAGRAPMAWPHDGPRGDQRVAVAALAVVAAATDLLADATGRTVAATHAALWDF